MRLAYEKNTFFVLRTLKLPLVFDFMICKYGENKKLLMITCHFPQNSGLGEIVSTYSAANFEYRVPKNKHDSNAVKLNN